jgi:hypothetical protein
MTISTPYNKVAIVGNNESKWSLWDYIWLNVINLKFYQQNSKDFVTADVMGK